VSLTNASARRLYERLGFRAYDVLLAVEIDQLEQQLAAPALSQSSASTHVQTDDVDGVRRAIAQFMPRVGRSEWSEVSEAEHGWGTVTDELCGRGADAPARRG